MFPEDNNVIATTFSGSKTTTKGKSFLFNFDKGEFKVVDGKVVSCDGIEALKEWITKALKTEKFKFKIYDDTGYGITLEDFTTSNYKYDFIITEIEREVKETLLKNAEIKKVHSFKFERIKRGINCSFAVETIYGAAESGVSLWA